MAEPQHPSYCPCGKPVENTCAVCGINKFAMCTEVSPDQQGHNVKTMNQIAHELRWIVHQSQHMPHQPSNLTPITEITSIRDVVFIMA